MQQYDLYQQQQIEVGDRVFYCQDDGYMPIGTVREKKVYPESVEYVVHFDDSSDVSYVTQWEDGKRRLQLYTKEKYDFFSQGRPDAGINPKKPFSYYHK